MSRNELFRGTVGLLAEKGEDRLCSDPDMESPRSEADKSDE